MIKPIVTMSQDDQDAAFYAIMDKLEGTSKAKAELRNIMANIYLHGKLSSFNLGKLCCMYKARQDAIDALKKVGAVIEHSNNNFKLVGFDDMEKPVMHFSNRYAPEIRV